MASGTDGPLIFIATNRLKDGKLAAERARVSDLVAFIDENESQLIAFNEYVNEAGTEVTVVQVHPDAASLRKHLGVVRDRAAAAYGETLDGTLAIQIYGRVDDELLSTLRAQTGDGVSLTVASEHLGGFTRTEWPAK
jgi:hypothetical protein